MFDRETDFENRITTPDFSPEDVDVEFTLRPKTLGEYIGQDKAKENLSIYIEAARQRGEALDHEMCIRDRLNMHNSAACTCEKRENMVLLK